MQPYQRPWWVLALKMPVLQTVLREEHQPNRKQFIIEGEPIFKSLIWITYGPGLAILAVIVFGALAATQEIRSQSIPVRVMFACGMVLVPLAVWAIGAFIISTLGQRHLAKEVAAHRKEVRLTLDLTAHTFQQNEAALIPFSDITDFKLVSDAGVYYDSQADAAPLHSLIVETNQGQHVLLPKELGSMQQKLQLLSQLRAIVTA